MSVSSLSPSGTSAGGWPAMILRAGATIFAGALLVGPAESTSASGREGARSHRPAMQSNAGMLVAQREQRKTADGLAQLRRLGGFTWEQIARVFSVSRRAVHFWASGQTMTMEHEEHLHRVLAAVRRIDRGSVEETRRALQVRRFNGETPIELLSQGRFEDAVALAGAATRQSVRRAPDIRERASEWRPEHLEGALPDTVEPVVQPRASTRTRVRRDIS